MGRNVVIARMRAIQRKIRQAVKANPSENATYRNRLALLAVFWLFMIFGKQWVHDPDPNMKLLAWGHLISLVLTIAARIWFLRSPKRNDVRLVILILIDCYTASVAIAYGGGAGIPFIFAYLWASFGNGFRFGVPMLRNGAIIGVISFLAVASVTPYWRERPEVAIMVLSILVILPAYAVGLIRQLERAIAGAEAASVAKSKFLAMMSHELRTPLNSIINLSMMLPNKGNFDADQEAMSMAITQSGEELLEMVDNVLQVARAEEQIAAAPPEMVDLYEIVKSVDLSLRPLAFQKKLQLQFRIDSALEEYVESTGAHLKKIMMNLAGNAIKFTETGGVYVLLSRAGNEEIPRLRIAVQDTGPGIPEERRSAIFQRFQQLDNAKNNQLGGVGLGLAIASDLVVALDGQLRLDTNYTDGTRFEVDLPLRPMSKIGEVKPVRSPVFIFGEGDSQQLEQFLNTVHVSFTRIPDNYSEVEFCDRLRADAALVFIQGAARFSLLKKMSKSDCFQKSFFIEMLAPEDEPINDFPFLMSLQKDDAVGLRKVINFAAIYESHDAETESNFENLTILVADDKKTNLEVARRILQSLGAKAVLATNGEEAHDLMARDDGVIDLVLMDVNMPVVDGIEATKLIRAGEAGGKRVPIVGLTADITEEGIEKCHQAGMDGVMHKPLRVNELRNLLQETQMLKPHETKKSDVPRSDDNVLDLPRLQELASLDPDGAFINEVAHTFYDDALDILTQAREAVDRRDVTALQKMRHAMRSTAVSFGATAIDRVCEEARSMDAMEIEQGGEVFINRLVEELRLLQSALRENNLAEITPDMVEKIAASANGNKS